MSAVAAVLAERAACADYLERKGRAAVTMIASRGVSADMASHVQRILNEVANDFRLGFHVDEEV